MVLHGIASFPMLMLRLEDRLSIAPHSVNATPSALSQFMQCRVCMDLYGAFDSLQTKFAKQLYTNTPEFVWASQICQSFLFSCPAVFLFPQFTVLSGLCTDTVVTVVTHTRFAPEQATNKKEWHDTWELKTSPRKRSLLNTLPFCAF